MTQNCSCHGSGGKYSQTVAAVLERPRYSPGLILEDSDLTSAVDYTRNLNRLLFRNLFGCGVVCGLTVGVETKCGLEITIAPGLALDGCGDPVELPKPVKFTLDEAQQRKLEEAENEEESCFWVVLCGGEKHCAPRSLVCESDEFDAVTQPTRVRAMAEVTLAFKRPECVCECSRPDEEEAAPPPQQHEQGPVASDNPDDPPRETVVEAVFCHHDHETRVECAPDCGCGTACACGCCVLLARIEQQGPANAARTWTAVMGGVRRFIRPKLLDDPIYRKKGAQGTQSASSGYGSRAAPHIDTAADQQMESVQAKGDDKKDKRKRPPADKGGKAPKAAEPPPQPVVEPAPEPPPQPVVEPAPEPPPEAPK